MTVNDYLAKRDTEWMGALYNLLGLTIGHDRSRLDDLDASVTTADITYGTNNEFGFDYLRDNMKTPPRAQVQRELNFAIVDEVRLDLDR